MFTRMRNLFQVTEIPLEPSPHQLRVSRSLARFFILLIAIVTIFYVISLAKLLILIIINLILLINVPLLCSTYHCQVYQHLNQYGHACHH